MPDAVMHSCFVPVQSAQADLMNCFIQKQDTVTIPPLSDPQLQNAAFSVIEAAKSQLSELKLADLFSHQLQGEKCNQFISEFLYHWAGVDAKPPESMIESSKKSLHSIIHGFLSTHDTDPSSLSEVIVPLLPYLTSVSEVDDVSGYLTRNIFATSESTPEEGANLVELATLGAVMSEISLEPDGEESETAKVLREQKRAEIQKAFETFLSPSDEATQFEEEEGFGAEENHEIQAVTE